jgi:hypothetical protein
MAEATIILWTNTRKLEKESNSDCKNSNYFDKVGTLHREILIFATQT